MRNSSKRILNGARNVSPSPTVVSRCFLAHHVQPSEIIIIHLKENNSTHQNLFRTVQRERERERDRERERTREKEERVSGYQKWQILSIAVHFFKSVCFVFLYFNIVQAAPKSIRLLLPGRAQIGQFWIICDCVFFCLCFSLFYILLCAFIFCLLPLPKWVETTSRKKNKTHKADSIMIIMFVEWGGTAECKTMQNVLAMDLAFTGK